MSGGPQIALLPHGRRLHLHHGPIDLIVEAFGAKSEIEAAYSQAARRFDGLLQRLVDELDLLRMPIHDKMPVEAVCVKANTLRQQRPIARGNEPA